MAKSIPQTTEQMLEARKATLVHSLLEKEPELTRELLLTMESLNALRKLQPAAGDYSSFRLPIDAVLAHLQASPRSMKTVELIGALIAGGFAPMDPNREKNIRAAIDYAVERSKRLVKLSDRTIDLPERHKS